MSSRAYVEAYKRDRVGFKDPNVAHQLLFHLMELFPRADSGVLRSCAGQQSVSRPDEQSLNTILDFVKSMGPSEPLKHGQRTASHVHRKRCQPNGNVFDPTDEHFGRSEALFVNGIAKSEKFWKYREALNTQEIIESIEHVDTLASSEVRPTKSSRVEERLLFYVFAASDVDGILSAGFDAAKHGFDAIGGIPFSEFPNLTAGHGESGLLLCRVTLGNCGQISKRDFLAGNAKSTMGQNALDSVAVSGSGNVPDLYVVRKPAQIIPYSIIRLKQSLAAKTILHCLEQDSGAVPNQNGTNGSYAANGQMLAAHQNNQQMSSAGAVPVSSVFSGFQNMFGFGGSPIRTQLSVYTSLNGTGVGSAPNSNQGGSYGTSNSSYGASYGAGSHSSRHSARAGHRTGSAHGASHPSYGASQPTYGASNPTQGASQLLHGSSGSAQGTPVGQGSGRGYVEVLASLSPEHNDENCAICTFELKEGGMYDDDTAGAASLTWTKLRDCGHTFHKLCFETMASGKSFLQCPQCKKVYGTKTGNQPVGGRMDVRNHSFSLDGYRGHGTIEISYSFPNGVQGQEHPHPGLAYHLVGFPRVGYLPDNEKGRKVLKLLKIAFERRLIFTVGRSSTTGYDDCVTWNDIHHKTSSRGGAYGYPDPGYLDNVITELAQHGVIDQ